MSLVDAPTRLLDHVLRRRDPSPGDPLVRHLSETMSGLSPDALFQRRVRAEMINRHLALSEGRARHPRGRRTEMGTLGRAVLYASVCLALSASAVGAAAQQSLPGDLLYGVKLRLEEIRIEIAPASLRPQLVALALDERLGELERLAARGDWAAAVSASRRVDHAAAELAAFGLGGAAPGDAAVERHAEALNGLLLGAPASARAGLEHALVVSGAATGADVSPAQEHAGDRPSTGAGGGQQGHAGPPPSPRDQAPEH